jgi:alcohol dehydrogenase
LIRIPDTVDFNRAAALPIAYGTAHRMLVTHGQLKPNERVLILGASGGVGTASVQIAKMNGAEVFACTSSEEKARKLQALGADHTVVLGPNADFSKAVWELSGKNGINVAVNFTGGDTWIPTIRTMARHGRILTCGSTAGHECMIDVRYIWHRELRILGSRGYMPSDIELMLNEVANGRLNPAIDRVMPLEDVREAMRLLEERKLFGKVILNP